MACQDCAMRRGSSCWARGRGTTDLSPSSSCESAPYLKQQGCSCHRQVEFKNGPPVGEACRAQHCRSAEAYTSVA